MSEALAMAPPSAPPLASHRRRLPASLVAGGILVGSVVVMAVISLLWTPHDPTHVDVPHRFAGLGAPGYVLGTDQFGRDTLSQLMVGARTTLGVGVVAVGIALLAGIPLGGLAAVRRGWIEDVLMRASDVVLAFPALLLAIMFAAVFRPGITTAMIAIGIAFVPVFARITRGAGLPVMERDFVTAARAFGTSRLAIFWRHLLPNVASVLIVQATVAFALAILAEAALSYLGLGTQPPTPSWGRMLTDAQNYLNQAPALALWPGFAIVLSVLGFNLLGDGLRDLLDPRLADRFP